MSVDEEYDPMTEHRTQFAFKGKREHISNINMPNITYPINTLTLKYRMVEEIM